MPQVMCLLPAPQRNVSMVYQRAVCRTGRAGFICCLIILPAVFPASTGFTNKPGREGSAPPCSDLADVPQEGALGWCECGVPSLHSCCFPGFILAGSWVGLESVCWEAKRLLHAQPGCRMPLHLVGRFKSASWGTVH